MKKLLVAIAVVTSIGVTLSESDGFHVNAQYQDLIDRGYSRGAALEDAMCEYDHNPFMGVDDVIAL